MSLLTTLSDELVGLAARTAPSVVSVEHYRGQATGIVLAPDGYILTNCHVVRSRARTPMGIGFADGVYVQGELVGLDPRTDLAVLHVDAGELVSLPLADSRRVRVGQLVVAIGNPFRFDRSMSLGVVSALDRSLPGPGSSMFEGLIQTDAAINPGNSGGPLLDTQGAVVGINTAIIPFAQGIGFAVPAYTASWVSAVLIQKGEVKRPFLGISARGVELVAAMSKELGQQRAVRVFEVNADTPAAAAGLKDGDILLSANGSQLASVDDLQRVMVLGEDDEIRLELLRDRRRHSLIARPERPKAA
jgi:S1-C subfamily serine protease